MIENIRQDVESFVLFRQEASEALNLPPSKQLTLKSGVSKLE
jgi:hypothetical protein